MKRLILTAILLTTLLSSCKEEYCPPPSCVLTMNFSVESLTGRETLPVDKLTMFLLDETTSQRIGPIYIDMEQAKQSTKQSGSTYSFSIKQRLPLGEYKMWIWGNVEDESIASFDWYSLVMTNDMTGGDYLLCKAKNINLNELRQSSDEVLERLTASVNFSVAAGVGQGVALYVQPVYTKVNADMVYSADNADRIDFELGTSVVPPKQAYFFPTIENKTTQMHFTYTIDEENIRETDIKSEVLVAGETYNIEFERL